MKTYPLLLLLMAIAVQSFSQGRIEVTVSNIKKHVGEIRVGLFNSKETFLEKAVEGKVVKVTGDKATVVFEQIQNGEYALSVFHDENENGELDTNAIGIPKEGFAFGNNAMGTFGPPSFDKAKVIIENNKVTQDIRLKYF